jgi:hypothetical protein
MYFQMNMSTFRQLKGLFIGFESPIDGTGKPKPDKIATKLQQPTRSTTSFHTEPVPETSLNPLFFQVVCTSLYRASECNTSVKIVSLIACMVVNSIYSSGQLLEFQMNTILSGGRLGTIV